MLRSIASHTVTLGHESLVLTAQPSYKLADRLQASASSETLDGVAVKRLSLLPGARSSVLVGKLNKAIWPARAALHMLLHSTFKNRPHVIVAATIPPVVNGLFGLLAARLCGARFVYHLQDIYPEIGAVGGLWKKAGEPIVALCCLRIWRKRYAVEVLKRKP